MADGGRPFWRRHPRILGLGGLAVAGAGLAIAVVALGPSGSSGYRTAVAAPATVRQTVAVSGVVQPVQQATVDFQTAGTVSAVDVSPGQQVTAGETVASLDPATLEQTVSSAQSNLSASEAKLAEDEAAQTSTVTSSGSSSTVAPSASGSGGSTALAQAQQQVVSAQQLADGDSQKSATALTTASAACGGTGSGTTTTTPTTTTTTPTTTPTTPTTTTTTPTTTSSACTQALDAALAAERQVASDQKAVATAEGRLAQLLTSAAGTQPSAAGASSSAGSPTPSGTTSSGTTSTGAGAGAGGSAAQLASDQAAVDSAEAALVQDQQLLADAQLQSPLTGTVVAVGLSAGQAVVAGSAADAVTIVSHGSDQVTAALTGGQASQVRVGDRATVSVDGTSGTVSGSVVRVGPLQSNGSSYTYPLVVSLPAEPRGTIAGSDAQVEVVLHEVTDTLAVPTSAVTTVAPGRTFVVVLRSGQPVRRRVVVGVVGAVHTQVVSGITEGATVVLADLAQGVPTSNSNPSPGGFGGGFGGGLGARRVLAGAGGPGG